MSWATAANVLALTGKTVTDQTVAEASVVIDIYANRTEEASGGMSNRDLGWLQRATAFQAAWMPSQPGFHQRNQYTEITQDGMQIVHGAEWEINLAPMAARALKNLSWKTSRTVRMVSVRTPMGWTGDPLLEEYDHLQTWVPFSIGDPGGVPCAREA
jgi:hypothetical protein